MFRLIWIGLVLFATGPELSRAAAGASAGPAPIVTEEEFLRALDTSHPEVRATDRAIAEARSGQVGAATLENPVLGVFREDPSGAAEQIDWTLSWQLPQPERGLRIRAHEQEIAAAEARRRLALAELREGLREVYAAWALASARRQVIAAQAQRLEALASRQGHRAELGETAGLEARRLRLAVARLRTRIAIADDARAEAEAHARATNPDLAAGAVPVLPSLPETAPATEDPALLQAARAEREAALLQQRASRRSLRAPELTVGWQRQETDLDSLDGPILGLQWSLPLFDRRRAEQIAAEARLEGAESRLEISRNEVRSQRSSIATRYRALRDAVAAAESSRQDAGTVLDGIEAAFRHGETSLTDLLETVRSIAELELAHLDLYATALAAHRSLERHQGLALPVSEAPPEPAKGIP